VDPGVATIRRSRCADDEGGTREKSAGLASPPDGAFRECFAAGILERGDDAALRFDIHARACQGLAQSVVA
jgi:hypothetical protein